MARYDYYCTHCGKQLNQDIVLFDMQYLLTREKERQFNILKFRMTQAELKALIASGTPAEAGYHSCKLTLPEVMRYISNPNNLNDADIAALTLEEIDEYIKQAVSTTVSTAASAASNDPFGFDDDEIEEEEDLGEEAAAPYITPPSILKIEAKDETNKDKVFTKSVLLADLQVLQGLFANNGVFEFQIREQNDVDNEGGDVLVGYNLNLSVGGYLSLETRVCSKCGSRVFSHAGTAKHQAVAFIGYAAAGKTSTILALAHYAENYMITGFGSQIWEGGKTVDSVATVEVLDKNDRFVKELKLYEQGVAPEKTKDTDRNDAYSATFRIKNRAENRYYLFTLTDLPGELFKNDGTVKREKVYNDFPVAVSCDAFVACFDTQSIYTDAGGGSVNEKVMNVCRWADEIQKMRADHNQTKTYVPTMLLFTKCQELETPAKELPAKRAMMPLERVYMLGEEKQRIAANKVYDFVCKQFNEFGQLQKGYHAMMRCSPFGYMAPSEDNWKKGIGEAPHAPAPRNIDQLMRWLLSVAGCIPTEASYAVTLTSVPFTLHNFCISRPQLRSQNPLESCDVEESMARCALFENPGTFDKEFVGKHGDKWKLAPVRMKSRVSPDTNDRE